MNGDPSLVVIVMGPTGCGKSTLGRQLARRCRARFVEGDAFHSRRSVAKMAAGIALRDADRWPWLDRLGRHVAHARRARPIIVACSALKRVYRDRLRDSIGGPLSFICLNPPRPVLRKRLLARRGHFMSPSLLPSQLAALQLPGADEIALIVSDPRPDPRALAAYVNRLRAACS